MDTANSLYIVDPGGIRGTVERPRNFQLADAKVLALSLLEEISREKDIDKYTANAKFFMEEQFNMIRGWNQIGKIFEVGVQVAPGFIEEYQG